MRNIGPFSDRYVKPYILKGGSKIAVRVKGPDYIFCGETRFRVELQDIKLGMEMVVEGSGLFGDRIFRGGEGRSRAGGTSSDIPPVIWFVLLFGLRKVVGEGFQGRV